MEDKLYYGQYSSTNASSKEGGQSSDMKNCAIQESPKSEGSVWGVCDMSSARCERRIALTGLDGGRVATSVG